MNNMLNHYLREKYCVLIGYICAYFSYCVKILQHAVQCNDTMTCEITVEI